MRRISTARRTTSVFLEFKEKGSERDGERGGRDTGETEEGFDGGWLLAGLETDFHLPRTTRRKS